MIDARHAVLGAERLRLNFRIVQRLLLGGLVVSGVAALVFWALGEAADAAALPLVLMVVVCCAIGVAITDRDVRMHDHGLAVHDLLGLRCRPYPWTSLTRWAHRTVQSAEGDVTCVWLRFGGRTTIMLHAGNHHFFEWLLRELNLRHAEREVEPEMLSR